MPSGRSPGVHKPRELRRRTLVPARLSDGNSWSDAFILDISSRGLMIRTGGSITRGGEVEIRRGDHAIVARVVWWSGGRAGLQAHERAPVEDILIEGASLAPQPAASSASRRKVPRIEDRSRARGRAIEFTGVLLMVISLAGLGFELVERAFAHPLSQFTAALSA